MEIISKSFYLNSSPQKIRLIVNLIRRVNICNSLDILNNINKKAAVILRKSLESAISNADEYNFIDIDKLKIKKIYVNNGPLYKRIIPKAKGKADYIKKRKSHVTIVLS
ncbi:50S ribosomal protein L22 [Candidatus Annandia adelgestsuga]|uniref:Large ribosomal subunit protein uL22 n=1 Tax=Candidatus Annandia adelgestsuga TaxID=1302411 RepID=A0A3S9J7J0_9ENTR|nr:50S ribosomal protein L22 [Candidatus Annandia adelgestsuga]AZP36217.1 50S ribosomal protein L22 [Candidatus Annandia adelgestsuga]